ncbi:SlyX family protein [Profundibacterium mesophilum]|uniref:Protein SlyX like protein n=1 Tax=Profundibacterium mesophilum KAUST100406-0324 TaxID=1037889 RepID=A0A921P0A7_9RHOB|nr:SlyX family protein [Profundibacterium mesophilum]KAF0676838.1 Protein SlyX like protein [Profundibacterium mesophilum KAUST100406-0324]
MTDDTQTSMNALEERIAHLSRANDDLSDIVAEQQDRIARIEARLEMVMRREAEREMSEGGTAPIADQRPPHW